MQNERVRWIGLWLATIVVAGWLGDKLGRDDASRGAGGDANASQLGGERRSVEGMRGARAPELGADELRALMREELRRADEPRQAELAAAQSGAAKVDAAGDDAASVAAGDAPSDGGAPAPSAEEKAQRVSDALAVVQGAVTSGQWRREERQRFAEAAQRLPAAELFEVTRQLNIAINRGEISIPDGLPPYGPSALLH